MEPSQIAIEQSALGSTKERNAQLPDGEYQEEGRGCEKSNRPSSVWAINERAVLIKRKSEEDATDNGRRAEHC
jgi:hypothetical protein